MIYISHIMLKTSLLASVANPNGVDGPGGPRMSDKERKEFDAILACLEKIHNLGAYAITMKYAPAARRTRRPWWS